MHELCTFADVPGLPRVLVELDALVADPWSDLRALGAAHIRRTLLPPAVAPG